MNRVAAVYRPGADGKITLLRKPEFREPTTYFPGVAGLNGTAADYFRFSQMLLNGGELDGVRLLGRMTVNMMFSNHIGTRQAGLHARRRLRFGLGAGVLPDPAKSPDACRSARGRGAAPRGPSSTSTRWRTSSPS